MGLVSTYYTSLFMDFWTFNGHPFKDKYATVYTQNNINLFSFTVISLLVNANPWLILLIGITLYYFWQKVRHLAGSGRDPDPHLSLSKSYTCMNKLVCML